MAGMFPKTRIHETEHTDSKSKLLEKNKTTLPGGKNKQLPNKTFPYFVAFKRDQKFGSTTSKGVKKRNVFLLSEMVGKSKLHYLQLH